MILSNSQNASIRHYLHPELFQFRAERIQYGGRLFGVRINPSAVPRKRRNPEFFHKAYYGLRRKLFQNFFYQRRRITVVTLGPEIQIRKIAFAVSRQEEFFPDAVIPLQQRNRRAASCRCDCGRHACRAAAEHQNIHHPFSVILKVNAGALQGGRGSLP